MVSCISSEAFFCFLVRLKELLNINFYHLQNFITSPFPALEIWIALFGCVAGFFRPVHVSFS